MRTVLWSIFGILGFASCTVSSAPTNDDLSLPSFDRSELPTQPARLRNLQKIEAPLGIRVLVFPHLGKYTVPQKKESHFDQVKFKTTGKCSFYEVTGNALLPEEGLDVASLTPKQVSSNLNVSTKTVTSPLWVECDAPVTLVRTGTALGEYTYNGKFYVRKTSHPKEGTILEVVNWINFEEYLKGVVPTEMPSSWHIEALKAQAVAARTYAMFEWQAAQGNKKDYDFDDTVQYQAYVGITKATVDTDRAVEETDSEILTYKGMPIIAYFSADSGGHTEDAINVWPAAIDAGYCAAKKELYDETWVSITDWKNNMSYSDFKATLVKAGMMNSTSEVKNVEVVSRFSSGRVNELKFTFANGIARHELATEFRYATKLRSTLFDFTLSRNSDGKISTLNFIGKGYGHGSGMSQWGAKAYADNMNWDYIKILEFYYSNINFCAMEVSRATSLIPTCAP